MSLLQQARSPYLSWLFSQSRQERHKTLSQAPGRALPKRAGTRELCYCRHLSRSSGVVLWGMRVMGWHLQGLASLLPNKLALLCLHTDSERVGQGQWTPYQTEWAHQIPARTSLHLGQRSFRRQGHYLYNTPPLERWVPMFCFDTRDSSPGPEGGPGCWKSFLGFQSLPHLSFVTALSHSSSVITSEVQRAIRRLYWIQDQALLRPRTQGLSLGIQYIRVTPGYTGNVVGCWGGGGGGMRTSSEYQLLPSRIYSLVKSGLVFAKY